MWGEKYFSMHLCGVCWIIETYKDATFHLNEWPIIRLVKPTRSAALVKEEALYLPNASPFIFRRSKAQKNQLGDHLSRQKYSNAQPNTRVVNKNTKAERNNQ